MHEKIIFENQLISFFDYLELSEGVAPRETVYGTDGKNHQVSKDGKSTITRFDTKDQSVLVIIDKTMRPNWYDIMFAVCKEGCDNNVYTADNYTASEQIPAQNFYDLFGKVLFVTFQMTKTFSSGSRLRFTGGYDRIARFYGILLNNKNLVQVLIQNGFEIDTEMIAKYGNSVLILKKV